MFITTLFSAGAFARLTLSPQGQGRVNGAVPDKLEVTVSGSKQRRAPDPPFPGLSTILQTCSFTQKVTFMSLLQQHKVQSRSELSPGWGHRDHRA